MPTTRQLVAWQTIGRLSAEDRLLLLVDALKDSKSRDYLPDEIEIFMGGTVVDSLLTAVIANSVDDQALVEQENRSLDLFEFQHNPAA